MRFLARTVFVLAILGAGCTGPYYYPPPYGQPGNIAVSWTFSGGSCANTPAVVRVQISVPSDPTPIQPNTFPCSAGDPPGQLVVYNYAPGSYGVNLVGLDANGNIIWTGSGTANVVAGTTVSIAIDLKPASGSNAIANLSWTFAPAVGTYFPPCTAAGASDPDRIDTVALYVDGANTQAATYDCSQGTGAGQVATPALSPGAHTLQLVAYQTGLPYSFAQTDAVPVTVTSGTPVAQAFTFNWLVGGVGVAWTYPSATACTPGGVASVTVGFQASGNMNYAVAGWPCPTAVAPFKRLPAADAGTTYAITLNAFGGGSPSPVLYSGTGTTVISPGHFYDGTAATVVSVPLN